MHHNQTKQVMTQRDGRYWAEPGEEIRLIWKHNDKILYAYYATFSPGKGNTAWHYNTRYEVVEETREGNTIYVTATPIEYVNPN